MNARTILTILTLVLLVGIASAQGPNSRDPNTWKNIPSEACKGYAIDALKAAVDPTKRVDQDWNLKAASAYLQLSEVGYQC